MMLHPAPLTVLLAFGIENTPEKGRAAYQASNKRKRKSHLFS